MKLLIKISKGRNRFVNIFPESLNGSSRFNNIILPKRNVAIVNTRIAGLSGLKISVFLKYFFLFNVLEMYEMISCSVPIGQIEEQYILPNKMVKTITTINPNAEILSKLRNLRTDGINCRYTIIGDSLGDIFPDKSR